MARGPDDDEREIFELWARLERLKVGIGGWIITGATMPPAEARAENIDGRIRDLIDDAIAVKARIGELSTPPARHARPTDPGVDPVGSPLSPVTGVPVVDLEWVVEPGSQVWAALEQSTRDRILRQRQQRRSA